MTPPGEQPALQIEFPARPEFVGMARHVVAAMARIEELPDDLIDDAKIAVSEACTNAVSANARRGGEPVALTARSEGATFCIEVVDRGDPKKLEEGGEDEFDSQEFSFERNLSMPLIRGLVDDLEILPRDGGGSVVRIRLPLPR